MSISSLLGINRRVPYIFSTCNNRSRRHIRSYRASSKVDSIAVLRSDLSELLEDRVVKEEGVVAKGSYLYLNY